MEDEPQEQTNDDEPADQFDPEEIENDPAYNPDDEELKGAKGG